MKFLQNKRFIDMIILACLVGIAILFARRYMDYSTPPQEDAAILMRYAEHFAQGEGIVWNVGETPVDGATDFLLMILIGVVTMMGFTLEMATRSVGMLSHFLTICVIYLSIRYVQRSGIWPAVLSALYFAIGPGLYLVAAYFGTSLFALAACITWVAALRIMAGANSNGSSALFALMSLITGLVRPEGVFLVIFMLIAILFHNGFKDSKRLLTFFALIFLVFGGSYFLWRWRYFGYPLPNPFYKKGGGQLYWPSLYASLDNALRFGLPFLLAFVSGLYVRKTMKLAVSCLIPIIGFVTMWILLSNEMNFGGRFQYPILPLVLLSWYPLVSILRNELNAPGLFGRSRGTRGLALLMMFLVMAGMLRYQFRQSNWIRYSRDGRYPMAIMLSEYADKGYTLATTEAGLLPLYSKWRSIDTWGLNDQWIAHNGGITGEYLSRHKPEVIMLHETIWPLALPSTSPGNHPWLWMIKVLKKYAEENDYVLAAIFGSSPNDTHCYYVSTQFPHSKEIVERIRSMEYLWFRNDRPAFNFALNK